MNLLPLAWGTIGRQQEPQCYTFHWRRTRTRTLCGLSVTRWRAVRPASFARRCQNCLRIMDAEERAAVAGEQ